MELRMRKTHPPSYAESTRQNVYPCGIIINQVNEGLGLHFFLEKSRGGKGGVSIYLIAIYYRKLRVRERGHNLSRDLSGLFLALKTLVQNGNTRFITS